MQGPRYYMLVYKSFNLLLLPLCYTAPTTPSRRRLLLVGGGMLKAARQVVEGVVVAVDA